MPRTAKILLGILLLCLVTFANPFEGNVLGFCPISEGAKAVGLDVIAAAIDVSGAWLIYSGLRG